MNISIRSWQTWKKHNNPDIWVVHDGIKGWARQTIRPTLLKNGFSQICEEYDYGFRTTTKQWAVEEAEFYLDHYNMDPEKCEFVYFYSRGGNSYMDYRALFVKKDE